MIDYICYVRLFFTLIIGLLASPALAQYIQIGEGYFLGTLAGPMASSTTSSNYGCRFAYIFPRSVLGNMKHGDTLESIEFMRSAGVQLGSATQFSIWLKNTSKSDFGAGKISFSSETGSAVNVYNATPANDLGGSEGFHRFPFSLQKYAFDTTKGDNLIVLIEFKQTVTQPGVVNWYFESSATVPGYSANQTKSFTGAVLIDSLATTSEYHPTVVFNYPRIDFDAAAVKFYTLGKLPVPLGNPDSVKLLVRNVGKKDLSTNKAFSRLKGVNTGLDSTSFSLQKGKMAFINMPSLNPSKKGLDTAFADVQDKNNSNNTARSYRFNNENIYSYRDVTLPPAPGGIGFNGASGDFVARFYSGKSKAINQVTVAFAAAGRSFSVGIWDNSGRKGRPGKLLYQSPSLNTLAGNYILDLARPVSVNGTFYVGVKQTGTINVAFGYQDESPVRPNTFFYATPTGDTNWVDFAPDAPYKFIIEPRLQGDTDLLAVSADFPKDSIDRFTMDTMAPRGTIANIGAKSLKDSFLVTCEILVFGKKVYTASMKDTMTSGLRRSYIFPKKFYPTNYGEHELRIIVSKNGDNINDNDTVKRLFFVGVKKDVMVSSVFDPYSNAIYEHLRDTLMPVATVLNPGYDNTISFTARCRILKGSTVVYNQTKTLSLPKFQSSILAWPTYKCTDTGRLQVVFTTEMVGDKQRSNDTQNISVFVMKSYDLGIDSIASPAKNFFYTPGKPIALRPRVYNDGLLNMGAARLSVRISSAYTPNVYADTFTYPLAGKDGYVVSMPKSFTPTKKGLYRAVFKVYHPADYVRSNDSMVRDFYVGMPYDYTTLSVNYPVAKDTLSIGGGPYAPNIRIANQGFFKTNDLVPFICQIWYGKTRVYQDIKSTTLDTGQVLAFDMLKTFNPINAGVYKVLAYTNYVSDVNRKNDSAWSSFYVAIGKDAAVTLIDSPNTGSRFAAMESIFSVTANIASQGKQAIGAVKTFVEVFNPKKQLVYLAFRNDTLNLPQVEKTIRFEGLQLLDSGKYELRIRIYSAQDQNTLNDTLRTFIYGYRRHDMAWNRFETPQNGQWLVNTFGNAYLRASLKQIGEDTTPFSGKAVFRVLDSISGTSLFVDTGSYSAIVPGAGGIASSSRLFPFIIAGAFRIEATLERYTDLFPENDTLKGNFRVVYNAVSNIPNLRFAVYPNPGMGSMRISASEPVLSATITDLAGKQAFPVRIDNNSYNTSGLAPGMYLINLKFARGNASTVWVKTAGQ